MIKESPVGLSGIIPQPAGEEVKAVPNTTGVYVFGARVMVNPETPPVDPYSGSVVIRWTDFDTGAARSAVVRGPGVIPMHGTNLQLVGLEEFVKGSYTVRYYTTPTDAEEDDVRPTGALRSVVAWEFTATISGAKVNGPTLNSGAAVNPLPLTAANAMTVPVDAEGIWFAWACEEAADDPGYVIKAYAEPPVGAFGSFGDFNTSVSVAFVRAPQFDPPVPQVNANNTITVDGVPPANIEPGMQSACYYWSLNGAYVPRITWRFDGMTSMGINCRAGYTRRT